MCILVVLFLSELPAELSPEADAALLRVLGACEAQALNGSQDSWGPGAEARWSPSILLVQPWPCEGLPLDSYPETLNS